VPNPPQPFPTDGVPTCIAQGAGGLIVGDLAGRIWSVNGTNATLLSGRIAGRHFTGCAADAAGNAVLFCPECARREFDDDQDEDD
jgi:hypothetical protein